MTKEWIHIIKLNLEYSYSGILDQWNLAVSKKVLSTVSGDIQWFIYMYLKGEFWETDEAPEPREDGIDKFQHGEESDEVSSDIGHQFNGGRSSSSRCLQEVPLLSKNENQ